MYILPKPQLINTSKEKLEILDTFNITNESSIARLGINKFKKYYSITENGTKINLYQDKTLKQEQYQIKIDNEIHLYFSTSTGAFNAFVTLKQIIDQRVNNLIPYLFIDDYPLFKDRGIMLDISRNRVINKKTIIDLICLFGNLKVNQLQFNLEGNAYFYESKKLYYNNKEDYLTIEDVREIDIACKENNIEFVPNQNSLGHMNFWLSLDEYKDLAECPNGFTHLWFKNAQSGTLNPSLKESSQFVIDLHNELIQGFTSKKFNIGADEPFELGLGKSKDRVLKEGIGKVYTDFINQIYENLNNQGYQIMMWGDVIKKHPESLQYLSKDIIALEWGYSENAFRDEDFIKYIDRGYKFYICPGTSMWNSIFGIHQTMTKNIDRAIMFGKKYNALGILLTDWGDGGSWQTLSSSYFPYLYGISMMWNDILNIDEIHQYLDSQVFNSKGFSKFVASLGYYSEIETPKKANATKLFKMLFLQQTDHINLTKSYSDPTTYLKDFQYLTKEEYLNYQEYFKEKLNIATKFKLNSSDKDIVMAEVLYGLKILYAGSLIGEMMVSPNEQKYEIFDEALNHLSSAIKFYDASWDARSKTSDKHLSMARMYDLERKLKAILNK